MASYRTWQARPRPKALSHLASKLMLINLEGFNSRLQRRCRNAKPGRRAIGPRYPAAGLPQNRFDTHLLIAHVCRFPGGSRLSGRARFFRECPGLESKHFTVGKNDAALDDILQFANVARPRIPLHGVQRPAIDLLNS